MENKTEYIRGEAVTTKDDFFGNINAPALNAKGEIIGYHVRLMNGRVKMYKFNEIKTSARNTYHKTKLDAIIADLNELKYDSQAFNCAIHNNAIDKAIEVIKQRLKP